MAVATLPQPLPLPVPLPLGLGLGLGLGLAPALPLAHLLVEVGCDDAVERLARVEERGATARDDALLAGA